MRNREYFISDYNYPQTELFCQVLLRLIIEDLYVVDCFGVESGGMCSLSGQFLKFYFLIHIAQNTA